MTDIRAHRLIAALAWLWVAAVIAAYLSQFAHLAGPILTLLTGP